MRISDWSSDVCSSDLHALLPRSDFAVIFADKPRALGNEQDATGRAVIDILRHLRGHLSRQIGPYSGNQRCRDQASGLEDIGRARLADTFGTFGGRPGAEFGRASGRERVWESV